VSNIDRGAGRSPAIAPATTAAACPAKSLASGRVPAFAAPARARTPLTAPAGLASVRHLHAPDGRPGHL
jgi:hypothetical protein